VLPALGKAPDSGSDSSLTTSTHVDLCYKKTYMVVYIETELIHE
jgi:hypothetical protein